MSEIENQTTVEGGEPTAVDERQQTAGPSARPACVEQAGLGRDDSKEEDASRAESSGEGNDEAKSGKPAGRCHHVMESGFYCQNPALRGRRYCYGHLRLRGQRLRMARAIAKRQPYRFDLPALDDPFAVQSAVEHVARALAAGLMDRRQAGTLLWSLQQSAINHRILALLRMNAGAGAPPLSPSVGDRVGDNGDRVGQQRLVEEYPDFEAEFGLPADIDVSKPARVLFPPPEDAWRVPTPARDPKTSPWCHRQPDKHWTREEIEREELNKQQRSMGEQTYLREVNRLDERIARQERKQHEAAWQAEADRRNAALEERERQFASMNEGERQAYNLGVVRAMEAVEEQAEQEERGKQSLANAV